MGKNLGLALQGGGSYAAFTGGVVEALFNNKTGLVKPDLVHSISGTSGGALNAFLLGLAIHRKEKDTSQYVKKLWDINRIERMVKEKYMPYYPNEFISFMFEMGRKNMEQNPYMAESMMGQMRKYFSLSDTLNEMLHETVPDLTDDVNEMLLENKKPYVTVTATEAKTSQAHYFTNNMDFREKYGKLNILKMFNIMKDLNLNGLFASAANPLIAPSVKMEQNIDWDGYYTSNPPFLYLIREGCDEIILVRLVQQHRQTIGEDIRSIRDRIEEIYQNRLVNMEITTYFAMRELLYNNKKAFKEADFELKETIFSLDHVYHEIQLLKAGNIHDEGFPVSSLVDRLIELGKDAVNHADGFKNAYQNAIKGHHVFTQINFDTGQVNSRSFDFDKLFFEPPEE